MVRVADYPQLRLIAWNVHEPLLEEGEAFALYERNWRFVDEARLDAREKALIESLARRYGHGVLNV